MSWDIFVQNFPSSAQTVEQIPDDYIPGPIGKRSEIIAKISEVVPDADFSDPSWGHIRGPDLSIEVSVSSDEPCMGLALFVRGAESAAPIVSAILHHLNLRAIETGTGGFFDHDNPTKGFKSWKNYRDQIVGHT